MTSTTVRINPHTHAKLKQLATESGESMPEVLDKAIETYRRQRFLEDANRAYETLRGDPKAWAHELKERAAWDGTLGDGIGDQ